MQLVAVERSGAIDVDAFKHGPKLIRRRPRALCEVRPGGCRALKVRRVGVPQLTLALPPLRYVAPGEPPRPARQERRGTHVLERRRWQAV